MNNLITRFLTISLLALSSGCGDPDLDDLVKYYDQNDGPGGYIAIYQNDEVVYSKGFGNAIILNSTKFTAQTIFPISSMSKHITAVCLLKLVEYEQISLNQDLLDFFPELSSFAKGITIADILNHTSGIPSRPTAATMRGQQIYKFEKDPIDWLVSHNQLEFEPGTKYQYSNTAYYLAGEIVRIVSKKSLAEFAHDEFFSKLGMSNTFYRSYPKVLGENVAMGYALNNEDELVDRPSKVKYIGGIGIFTTIEDFKIWDEAFRNNTVLSPELYALFKTSYQLKDQTDLSYAYGLRLEDEYGIKKEFHGGQDYDIGYVSYFVRYPDYDLTYVIFSNNSKFHLGQARAKIEEYIVENKLISSSKESLALNLSYKQNKDQWQQARESEKIKKSLNDLEPYLGKYYNENIDVNYRLSINEESSTIEIHVNEIDPVNLLWLENNKAIASKSYEIDGIWLSAYAPIYNFIINDGEVVGFDLDGGGTNNIRFIKVEK